MAAVVAKLYPPIIEGTLPAFNGTTKQLVVPFSMNRAVSRSEVKEYIIQVKDVQGNFKGVARSTTINGDISKVTFDCRHIEFTPGSFYKIQMAYVGANNMVGYYSTIGVTKCTHAPQISVEHMTTDPRFVNSHQYRYVGVYRNENDPTEKMYSCRFKIYDIDTDDIIIDSGEILHNITEDVLPYEQREEFYYPDDLDSEKMYILEFIVKTTNNLLDNSHADGVSSPLYKLVQKQLLDPDIPAELIASVNYDEGYTSLKLQSVNKKIMTGKFVISRAASNNNYRWENFFDSEVDSILINKWELRDYLIEQGVYYVYSIQQYNEYGLYSNRLLSNTVYADFEDAFLYDGEIQLKLRFNPKVSVFKTNLGESKIETIGGKYPFIFKSGYLNYKEFNIGGLISYQEDENEAFVSKVDIGLGNEYYYDYSAINSDFNHLQKYHEYIKKAREEEDEYEQAVLLNLAYEELDMHNNYLTLKTTLKKLNETSTDLTSKNIAAERMFKTRVLDWLNNGEPKIFKTPAEGNYLVRLMNVSLSPIDSLGRMLHNFTATAYEIGECKAQNLLRYNPYGNPDMFEQDTQYAALDLSHYPFEVQQRCLLGEPLSPVEYQEFNNNKILLYNKQNLTSCRFDGLLPGTKLYIYEYDKCVEIVIGASGNYVIKDASMVERICMQKLDNPQGIFYYSGPNQIMTLFDMYKDLKISEVPIEQFIGQEYTTTRNYNGTGINWDMTWKNGNQLIKEISYKEFERLPVEERTIILRNHKSKNLLAYLEDVKTKIIKPYFYRFEKRPIYTAYVPTGMISSVTNNINKSYTFSNLYKDMECLQPYDINKLGIYLLKTQRTNTSSDYVDYSYHYVERMEDGYPFSNYISRNSQGSILAYDAYFKTIIYLDDSYFDLNFQFERHSLEEPGAEVQLVHFNLNDREFLYFDNIAPCQIIPSNGIISEISYSKQIITYRFEATEETYFNPDTSNTIMSTYMENLIQKIITYKKENDIEI